MNTFTITFTNLLQNMFKMAVTITVRMQVKNTFMNVINKSVD